GDRLVVYTMVSLSPGMPGLDLLRRPAPVEAAGASGLLAGQCLRGLQGGTCARHPGRAGGDPQRLLPVPAARPRPAPDIRLPALRARVYRLGRLGARPAGWGGGAGGPFCGAGHGGPAASGRLFLRPVSGYRWGDLLLVRLSEA